MAGKRSTTKNKKTAKTEAAAGSIAETVGVYRVTKRPKYQALELVLPNRAAAGKDQKHVLEEEPRNLASLSLASEIRMQIASLQGKLRALEAVEKPKIILPELHDSKNGRIDAQKVADFVGVPLKPLSEGLRLNYKAVHRNSSATGFQEALRPLKRSLELLHEFFGPVESIRIWLNTPHPDLDGTTALETILEGKASAVRLILENAWNGVPV